MAELIVNDGLAPSAPDQVTVTAANRPPVADAGPDQAVSAGNPAQLDGSGSFDADGDPITFAWALISTPADSTASLSDPSLVDPSFVTDAPGAYVAELIVDDGTAPSPADQVTVTADPVTGANSPPVLAAIGDLSVDLGSTLILDLAATDVNGDTLAFSAAPLPLPAGAGLNGASGLFTFSPDETQVGDIALTFLVSDGLATDSESVTITVVGPPLGGTTAISGRLLDATDADIGITTPLVGATIFLLNDTETTVTDANGDFLLSGVPSGAQVFAVDSSTAAAHSSGEVYASFREELTLIADVTNVIARPIYLPRVDPNGVAFYDANGTEITLVENAPLGVSLEVPPDTAMEEDGVTEFNGEISISEVPLAFAPMPLPDELQPALLLSIQPTGVTFTQPQAITFPNLDGLPAGSEVDIYSLDAAIGSFVVVGTGTVSPDGSKIETTSGGIIGASWHFPLPPRPSGDASGNNGDNQDHNNCVRCDTGSGTHISSGNLTEDHSLANYRSLNQARSLRFVYNSAGADPQPIVVTDTTLLGASALPNTVSTRLEVAGVDLAETLHTTTAGLSFGVDETIHQAVQFDATGFATGSYAYELAVTNHFDLSSVSAIQSGRVLVNNESASPFGAGWTLDGLERLHFDGLNAVITRGDGSILRFAPDLAEGDLFTAPIDYGPVGIPRAFAIDDLNNDTIPDLAVPDQSTGNVVVMLGDGSGAFPVVQTVVTGAGACHAIAAVATGDFNEDGLRDLATVFVSSLNQVRVLLGTGGGAFGAPLALTTGSFPSSVGVADFDDDGHDDVVAVTLGPDDLEFFHGDGLGGFGPRFSVATNRSPHSILIDDFNNDALPDLAIQCPGTSVVAFHLNNPANPGTFTFLNKAGGGGFSGTNWALNAADFDGDGDRDVVMTTSSAALYVNSGVGTSWTRRTSAIADSAFSGGEPAGALQPRAGRRPTSGGRTRPGLKWDLRGRRALLLSGRPPGLCTGG